jgi:hypothetical protein
MASVPMRGPAPLPSTLQKPVLQMTTQEKVEAAIRLSLPLMSGETRAQVQALISPQSLMIITGTLVLWAGSHFFGVGEIVDVIGLLVGFALLGASVLEGARSLYDFANGSVGARSEDDLKRAAQAFAHAVNVLGISAISAVLLHRSSTAAWSRGAPRVRPMVQVGTPPAGIRPIRRPFTLPGGAAGETDWWGNIQVIRNQPIIEQRLTLYHEWIHSVLSPRVGPLRTLRAQIHATAYLRSALLCYLEEAVAESYAQLRVRGLSQVMVGIRFPVRFNYVTVSELITEGAAIGNIIASGQVFRVSFMQSSWLSLSPAATPGAGDAQPQTNQVPGR